MIDDNPLAVAMKGASEDMGGSSPAEPVPEDPGTGDMATAIAEDLVASLEVGDVAAIADVIQNLIDYLSE